MKKSATNSRVTISKNEKGLRHLRLVGVGRKYVEKRLAEMQDAVRQKELPPQTSSFKTNGKKIS